MHNFLYMYYKSQFTWTPIFKLRFPKGGWIQDHFMSLGPQSNIKIMVPLGSEDYIPHPNIIHPAILDMWQNAQYLGYSTNSLHLNHTAVGLPPVWSCRSGSWLFCSRPRVPHAWSSPLAECWDWALEASKDWDQGSLDTQGCRGPVLTN